MSVLEGMIPPNPLSCRALLKWLQSMKESPCTTVAPTKSYKIEHSLTLFNYSAYGSKSGFEKSIISKDNLQHRDQTTITNAVKALHQGVINYLLWVLVPPGRNPVTALFRGRGRTLEKN
jgi:hypothetical protein